MPELPVLQHAGYPLPFTVTLTAGTPATFAMVPPPGATMQLTLHGAVGMVVLTPSLHPDDPQWYWHLPPTTEAGDYRLMLTVWLASGHPHSTRHHLRLLPAYLSPQQYSALLDEISTYGRTLALALHGGNAPATLAMPTTPVAATLLEQHAAMYARHVQDLARLVAQLEHSHATQQRPAPRTVPSGQLRTPPLPTAALSAAAHPNRAGVPLPPLVRADVPQASTALPEHRLLKYVVQVLQQRAATLARHATAAAEHASNPTGLAAIAHRARGMLATLTRLLHRPWLADLEPLAGVREPTHLMRHDPRYQQVYSAWRSLMSLPVLSEAHHEPPTLLPLAPLARLYEVWCALHTLRVLLALPAAQVVAAGWHPQHEPTRLPTATPLVRVQWRGGTLKLRYQPRYTPTSTPFASRDATTHIPDLVLEWNPPAASTVLLILDAKYRQDAQGRLPSVALQAAYTYLGAIGWASGEPAVRAVALLYPAAEPAAHYRSNISALPLLPGATAALDEWLMGQLATTS